MRTDYYVGIVRAHRDAGWTAARGVGSATVELRPPMPPCLICGADHESKRATRAAHKGHPDVGRAVRAVPGVWPTVEEATSALLAELVPLYLEACRDCYQRGEEPPPLLLVPPIDGEGNAWEYLVEALARVRDLGAHLTGPNQIRDREGE